MLNILKPVISVDLDEVYVKQPCSCTNISSELLELSTKFEHCCFNMSIELSNIWKAIDDLSGKINDISSQISGDDEPAPPPTIFAYSTSDQEITAKIAEAGAWNTEPFPGFISSADTEMIEKLSAVLPFEFPEVVKIEDYSHVWDSESIAFGETNYCSYFETPPVGYKTIECVSAEASYQNNFISADTIDHETTINTLSVFYRGDWNPTWPASLFEFPKDPRAIIRKLSDGKKYYIYLFDSINITGARYYMYEFGYSGPFRDYFVAELNLAYDEEKDCYKIIPSHDPTPPNI